MAYVPSEDSDQPGHLLFLSCAGSNKKLIYLDTPFSAVMEKGKPSLSRMDHPGLHVYKAPMLSSGRLTRRKNSITDTQMTF